MHNLTPSVVTQRVSNAVAGGTTAINSDAVDTQSFLGVRFAALLGALTATQVTGAKLQYSADGATGWADVAGSAVGPMADGDSNKMLVIELYRPQARYVRMVVTRATANAALDAIIAELFQASRQPVTQDADVSASSVLNSAVAGAA